MLKLKSAAEILEGHLPLLGFITLARFARAVLSVISYLHPALGIFKHNPDFMLGLSQPLPV